MGMLNEWADENSEFITFKPNSVLECEIIDYERAVNRNGKPVIIYKIVPRGKNYEKKLQSSAIRLARAIAALPNEGKGCLVKITKTGEGFDTKYSVVEIEP